MKLSWPVAMVRMMKNFYLSLMLALLSSCAALDVDYHMPLNRFETPETAGKSLGGMVAANIGSTQKITLTEVYDDSIFGTGPHVDDGPKMERSASVGTGAALGMLENLDLFYRGLHDSPDQFGFKFQMLGEGREKLSVGNKMAFTAAYGASDKDDGSVRVSSDLNGGTRDYNSNLKITSWDFSLLYGYRLKDWALAYTNIFWTQYKVEAQLTSNVHPDVSVTGIAKTKGALVGLKLDGSKNGFFILAEVGAVNGNWNGDINTTSLSTGLSSGFNW